MDKRSRRRRGEQGLSLIEVIVAIAIFTLSSVAAAHLLVWAARTLWIARAETTALAAAHAKMEELQALAWRFDAAGNRVSDRETDLAADMAPAGGAGLSAAPPSALTQDVAGYVDYLDQHGRTMGAGQPSAAGSMYVRRWAVRPLATAPEDTLVFQVVVLPLAAPRAVATARAAGRVAGGSALTTARTRVR